MLECANPACRKRLSSPGEGQTLEFEIVSVSIAASDQQSGVWDESPKHQVARVHLCSECARTVSVTVGTEGLTVVRENVRSE